MEHKLTKILAIDDNTDNLITIKALIAELFQDISVLTASTGDDGIKLAEEEVPDVILLDVVMPDMDGFEVCKRLKSLKNIKDIPVIFVTSLKEDKENRIHALEVGAEGFLAKPIDQSELFVQVSAMLKIREAKIERQNENERLAALVAERTKELKHTHTATLNLLEDLQTENEARRKIADALIESQQRLIRAELASKSGNWELHLDQNILIASEGAKRLYGLLKAENLYDYMKVIPLPEYRTLLDKSLENLIENDEPYNLEFKIGTADTGEVLDIHSMAFFDKERRIVFAVIQDITERKQAQKALHESEELYRSVINASPDNITVTDLSGNILMVSPNGSDLIGCEQAELLIGRNIQEFLVPEHRVRAKENIQAMFQGIFTGSDEYDLIRFDGTVINTDINAEFVKDENGESKAIVFAIRDVTERKLAQDAIRESERKYRLITEKISDVVWIMDLTGKSTFVSQSIKKFTGYTVDEYLAQSIRDRFTPESTQLAISVMRASIESSNGLESDIHSITRTLILDYVCKDGSIKTGELLITPYFDENNKFVAIHGVTRDVTERKKAQEALLASEAKYRFMAENSSDVVWHMDTDFCFDYVSPSEERLTGNKPEELIGRTLWSILKPEGIELVKSTVENAHARKEKILPTTIFKFEFERNTKASNWIWIEVTVSLHMDDDGSIAGYHGVTRDISGQKQAQEALLASEEKYRSLVENSPNGIAIYQDGVFVYVNRMGLKMVGADNANDLIGRPVLSIVHPDSLEAVMERVSQVSIGSDVPPLEEKLIRFDGTVFDAEVTAIGTTFNGKPAGQVILNDITERKIAAIQLKESEEKFRDMADLLPQVIFELNLEGKITYLNQQADAVFGYLSEELVGQSSLMVHVPDERDRVMDGIRLKLAGIPVNNNEFTMLRKDGSEFPALIYINPIVRGGNAVGIRGVITDMTEQKKSQKALQESEALYRAIIDASPDYITITDLEGRVVKASPSTVKKYGFKDESEVIGQSISEFIVPEDKERMYHDFTLRVNDGTKTGPNEYKALLPDGSSFDIEVNGGLITNSEGEIVRFISMARDITERKAVQDSLLESEDRYNSFINNNIDRIFVKDENCRYLIVNDAMADFFGKTKEEILNKTDRELADGKLIYPSGSSDLRALESKNAFVVEEKLGDRIYETIKFPMQLKNQRTGIGGIMRDITERKMAEERLNYVARLYALLSQINQSIVRIKSIDELFEMTCNMAIEFGQFHMCWIGFYDETEEMIKPVSCAGHNEGYVESLHIYPYRNPRGKGPTGRAFLEGMVVASNNIAVDPKMKLWRDEALKRGYRSLLSTPLLRKGKPMGTLTVYAVEVNFFDDEEQKLLQEIGIDISYAIDAIDSENERKAAEEAVIRSEAKYRDFVENSPEAIAIYADNVVTYVNKECLRLMRAESKDQLIGVCMSLILFIPITDKSLLSG